MLHVKIGNYSGKIWRYLETNGETSYATLKKEVMSEDIPMKDNIFAMALGWLSREGNVTFTESGEGKRYRLSISLLKR